MTQARHPRARAIVTAALAALAVAGLGALSTDLGPWYAGLREPAWKPPDILFGPAWMIIYACAATAGLLAWPQAPRGALQGPALVASTRESGSMSAAPDAAQHGRLTAVHDRWAQYREDREWMRVAFALNATLNVVWSLLFFRLRRPDWALAEVGALWLSIVLLIALLGRRSRLAGWLLVPYLGWVSFAATLNLAVVRLNSPFGGAWAS